MASHAAFKIRIVRETYQDFFASIQTGGSLGLGAELEAKCKFINDAWPAELDENPPPARFGTLKNIPWPGFGSNQ